jgi:hypothetical protein
MVAKVPSRKLAWYEYLFVASLAFFQSAILFACTEALFEGRYFFAFMPLALEFIVMCAYVNEVAYSQGISTCSYKNYPVSTGVKVKLFLIEVFTLVKYTVLWPLLVLRYYESKTR